MLVLGGVGGKWGKCGGKWGKCGCFFISNPYFRDFFGEKWGFFRYTLLH